ncbi:hypothetical protein Vafri_1213 [Volvox africanus]|nr:hypothetical protein Vafri_1213 [Volvox africanus]
MAFPARLATANSLQRTHQTTVGSSSIGREHSNVPGVPFRTFNALPRSTSLPRLGPESLLHLRRPGEVVLDTALLPAPTQGVTIRQFETGRPRDEGTICDTTSNADLCTSGPSTAAAAVTHGQAGIGAAEAQDIWNLPHSEEAHPQLPGPGEDQRRVPALQLQPPPRPGIRSTQCASPAPASPQSSDGRSLGLDAPSGTPAVIEWSLRSPEQLYCPPSAPSVSAPPPAAATRTSGDRHRGRSRVTDHGGVIDRRRHDALLARVLAATNWYELRAVLVTGGGGGGADAAVFAASPDAVLTVLRRLAVITAYSMRPPESADLGAFLERWLLQHMGVLRLMGPAQLSLCLHSLAKLSRALPGPPPAWTAAWFAAAQPFLLQCSFRPKDVSLSLWALSRLQMRLPLAALQLLLAAAEPHLQRFNGQDLSLVALALSALQAQRNGSYVPAAATQPPPPPLLPSAAWQESFLARCSAVLPECGSQALANLLHGVVRSGMAVPDWLLGDMCAALYGKLPDCNPQALSNVLSALAAAGYAPEEGWVERFLLESLARMPADRGPAWIVGEVGEAASSGRNGSSGGHGSGRGTSRASVCNLDDLTHMAAAAAQLTLPLPQWWVARLHSSMEQLLPRANPRQLAQALHAVAQLYRVTAATQPRQRPSPLEAPANAAAAAHGGSKLEADGLGGLRPPRSLLATWHHVADAAIPRFNAIDVAHSLWALAALGERPSSAWLQRLLVTCRGGLAAAPPGDLAILAWSLAALGFRPTWSYVADLVDASESVLGAMKGQDYAMLTSALVRLGSRPRTSWSTALLDALQRKLPQLDDRSLSQTTWALYRLRVQPTTEWLRALVSELKPRWQKAGGMVGGEGEGDGEGGSMRSNVGQELRNTVVLLWVMSMWIGPHQRRQRQRRRRWHVGGGSVSAVIRRLTGGLSLIAVGDRTQGQASELRPCCSTGGVGAAGAPLLSHAVSPGVEGQAATAAAAELPAMTVTSRQCCRRVSTRMLRRRRAAKSGNIVAAPESRRQFSDQLLGPAMDATAATLAAGYGSAQDVSLLLAAMQRLQCTARRAAATRPVWLRAVLAAALPRLRELPPNGLLQVFSGLAALRLTMGVEEARQCAAAAAPHLAAHQLPASYKVSLLMRLCRMRVIDIRAGGGVPEMAAAAAAGASPGGYVLAAGLRVLRRSSEAAEPLLRLHVELLKARVRLRKLGVLGDQLGSSMLAAAVLRRIAAAQASGLSAAAAADQCSNTAEQLTAATAEIRAAVATAAAAVAAKAKAKAVASEQDIDDDDVAGDSCICGGRRSRRVPPIGENQRSWIWRRARRTVAARMADGSPVLVMQLVQLASENTEQLLATGPMAVAEPLASPGSTRAAGITGAVAADRIAATEPLTSDSQCGRKSLLWLATATNRSWRVMLPVHRARVVQAWRRVLDAVQADGESQRSSNISCGSIGADMAEFAAQLQTALPPSVVAAAAAAAAAIPRRRQAPGRPRQRKGAHRSRRIRASEERTGCEGIAEPSAVLVRSGLLPAPCP